MNKFFTWDFLILLLLASLLLIIHELGHYLAFRILGYKAVLRKSIMVPGIDPVDTIDVTRWKGFVIALGGFVFSTIVIVVPAMLLQYKL